MTMCLEIDGISDWNESSWSNLGGVILHQVLIKDYTVNNVPKLTQILTPKSSWFYNDRRKLLFLCFVFINSSQMWFLQILFSADDEMDESDEDDVRRLTGMKTVKKKKLRMGIPVWPTCLVLQL